jgi:hypothetical protein
MPVLNNELLPIQLKQLDFHKTAVRGGRLTLHCRSTPRSIADLQSGCRLRRKLTVGPRHIGDGQTSRYKALRLTLERSGRPRRHAAVSSLERRVRHHPLTARRSLRQAHSVLSEGCQRLDTEPPHASWRCRQDRCNPTMSDQPRLPIPMP